MLLAARASRVDEGYVSLFCHLTATGDLTTCRVMSEDPSQGGYGAVSLALAEKLKVTLPANLVVDPNDEVAFSIGYRRDGRTTICAPPFCVNEGPPPPPPISPANPAVPVGAS